MSHSLLFKPALYSAFCLFALPVAAQDLCGGMGSGGQWIGGNEAASDISTSADYQEQMALVLGGNEHVALFSLSQPTGIRVEAQGRGAGDPQIDLVDQDGNILISDDDSGGNGASRAEVDLEPGTYCLSTTSFDGAPMTAFVRVSRLDQEALTDGIQATTADSGVAAGNCSAGVALGSFSGTLTSNQSVNAAPFLTFTLDAPTAISITANNEDADPVLTLYDSDENYIDENDDFDGLNSRIDQAEPLAAGDYCIGLDALNDGDLPVAVEITVYDPDAALAALIDRGEAAPPMDGTVQINDLGTVNNRLRHDAQAGEDTTWFSIDMPEQGVLLIEAISPGGNGDPWLVVYDDLGREIAQNDDYGTTYDSLIAARMNRGTFIIGLKDVGGTTGLARMVFERYVPAP